MRALVRQSLAGLKHKSVWLAQCFGNLLLFAGAVVWLRIPDERTWQLVATVALFVAVAMVAVWLHATTFAALPATPLRAASRAAIRRAGLFLPWVIGFLLLLMALSGWGESAWQLSGYLESRLPTGIRSRLGFNFTQNLVSFGFVVLFWYVIPALLLPIGMAAVHYRSPLPALRRFAWWMWFAVLVTVGAYIPQLLVEWKPGTGLTAETISVVLRLLVAYVLAIGAWMATLSALAVLIDPDSARGGDVGGKPAA